MSQRSVEMFHTVTSSDLPCRLFDLVAATLGVTRSHAKRVVGKGFVQLNGTVHRAGAVRLAVNDFIEIIPLPKQDNITKESLSLIERTGVRVILESKDASALVAWKPAGMKLRGNPLPQGSFATKDGGFEYYVQQKTCKPFTVAPGHVLPKAAAGLVLLNLDHPATQAAKFHHSAVRVSSKSSTYKSTAGDEESVAAPSTCPNCAAGHRGAAVTCLVTRAILCGACPASMWLTGDDKFNALPLLLLRTLLTRSNRYGMISTVEMHAPYIPHQAWLQRRADAAGFPVVNDPRRVHISHYGSNF